ncbi:MAG: hypothetical protein K0B07_02020 [DPANN group archaeon]|nr:hypothetical protein [DPANN group archaeon]
MRLEGLRRVDVPEINKEALREAIINAFCHRDYYKYDSVNVAVFKNRVEIRNPGKLYDGLTIDEIIKGNVSRRRNELIAEMFNKVHYVDKWGRGIDLILSKEHDTEFKETFGMFVTVFFEFASWSSVEFKLYLIKEFQRLKINESKSHNIEWNVKRQLVKINYKIHTNAIKENLIPNELTQTEMNLIYANEADVLNMALFGKTAKEWREDNNDKNGNIRDYANVAQLVCLSNLENLNASFIA